MKDIVRRRIKSVASKITEEERIHKSNLILKRLFSLDDFEKAKRAMVYVSKKSEADTIEIIKHLLKNDKAVIVPKVENRKIVPCKIKSIDELTKGEFGILEPRKAKAVKKISIDFFIVPGLAFDMKGNRVGYGHGYWDRFLKGVEKKRIVGLAFESQIVDNIEAESHDIAVSKIVTEKRIIICQS